jgi:RNA polymerase sigma-70 factor (ECF subfamily)
MTHPTVLAALYSAESARLERLLIRRGLSAPEAADLVQDVFLRLIGVPAADVEHLRAYLYRSAKNLFVDMHRRRQRVERVLDSSAILDDDLVDPMPAPEAVLLSQETSAALASAIQTLSPRSREVLLLHKFEGLSYTEIADKLGIAKNTVTVHMVNALSGLKRHFASGPATS